MTKHLLLAAATAALAWSSPAAADEDMPAEGLLQRVERGDVACYLHIADTAGGSTIVPADFDLCAREDLIGLRVALTYETARVLAAGCEGDPECPDTEEAQVAVKLTPVK